MPELVEVDKKDKTTYSSGLAQTIEASGNFINNISNPFFVLILVLLVGGGYLFFRTSQTMSDSVDKLTSKIDLLATAITEQQKETIREVTKLNQILRFNTTKKVVDDDDDSED